MPRRLIIVPIAALLMAGTSWAEAPRADYGRSGWYAGISGGAAFDFLEDAIKEKTSGVVDISTAGSFNARGGYRLTSWFAFEIMYEGVYNLKARIGSVESASSFDSHSILGNLKLILPIRRVQPYLTLGPGAQHGDFDALFPLDALDTSRWDFMLRIGVGLDTYITENWLVNFELAPSVRFADYSDIPSETTDNVLLTVSGGIQYRF